MIVAVSGVGVVGCVTAAITKLCGTNSSLAAHIVV